MNNVNKNKYLEKQITKCLYSLYEKKGDYKRSIDYFKRYVEITDMLVSEDVNAKTLEIGAKYETEKKEKELLKLEKEKEIRQLELDKQRSEKKYIAMAAVGAVVISLVLLIFIIIVTNNLKRNKQQKIIISNQKNEV